ncbi:hypothetical protein [Fictibacillus fluitans]|uniref:Uncharacterized protein n=1 Tax=Fictibacillus fluitans TaxID=3058422 RepID=A0ABT8HX66_9BACL|nr:hypothetical protein [Fictibacillus sp. NE201]MDN4525354.1 hypothetical protein [Fictibacillus sp. NE201]
MKSNVPYKVGLPRWIWEDLHTQEERIAAIKKYMKTSYPHYIVKGVKGREAICYRRDEM